MQPSILVDQALVRLTCSEIPQCVELHALSLLISMACWSIRIYPLQITKASVVLDATLLSTFTSAIDELQPGTPTHDIERVHQILLAKIYNARSNDFVRTISKLECSKQKKAVDVNIGLRDKLKSYAAERQSTF
jgi:hypothetical protein